MAEPPSQGPDHRRDDRRRPDATTEEIPIADAVEISRDPPPEDRRALALGLGCAGALTLGGLTMGGIAGFVMWAGLFGG